MGLRPRLLYTIQVLDTTERRRLAVRHQPSPQPGYPAGAPHYPSGEAPSLYTGLWGTLRSPGSAMAMALLGYYSLAGFSNVLAGDSNVGGILIRLLSLVTVVAAFAGLSDNTRRLGGLIYLPAGLFFLAYFFRMVENIFFLGIRTPGSVEMMFAVFLLSSIFTSFILARVAHEIREYDFTLTVTILNFLFLVGMALNRELLLQSVNQRMMLEKINPISMAHLAASFLIFHFLFFRKSKSLLVWAVVTTPLLLLVIVYARSRGPILAPIVSLALYALLLKGTRRIWMGLGLTALALGVLWLADGGEYLNIVTRMFERTDIETDESTQVHYLGAIGAWNQFLDDIFFGRYIIETVTGYYPHNLFLEALMSVGLIGSLPLAIHLGLATRATIGIIRSHRSVVSTFIAVIFIRDSIAAFLAGAVWGSQEFWIGSFVVIALWYGRQLPPIVANQGYGASQFRH